MTRWLLLLMAAALFALVAACGDDDDDDDGGGDELTEEEYFMTMDTIDKDLDAQFDEAFSDQEATAVMLADGFVAAVDSASEQYTAVNAPADLDDEHQALVDAIDTFGEAMSSAAEGLEEDAPSDEFQALFGEDEVSAANDEVTAAFCAIQDAADAAGVEADVGCDEGGDDEDAVDPDSIPPEEVTEIDIAEFAFNPPHIQVVVGDTVTWTNSDEDPHDATADDESFETDTLSTGDSGEVTFDEAGVFSYFCSIHPDMLGQVTVVE